MDCAVWQALGDSSSSDLDKSSNEIDVETGSNEAHQSGNDISMSTQDAEPNPEEVKNPLIKVTTDYLFQYFRWILSNLKEGQLYESYKEALKLLHASKTHDAEVLLNEALNSRLLFNEVWH